MAKREHRKRNCLARALIALLVVLIVALGSLALATHFIVRHAEAQYPPTTFTGGAGTRLHYVSEGSGLPVVFIHGGGGRVRDFSLSPAFAAAAGRFQVIVFDRPGLGYSEKPADEKLTSAVQARVIHDALQELQIQKPVLLGQSWGGVVALAYALDYPESVSGVVLLGVAPYPRERATDPFLAVARMPVLGGLLVHTLYVPVGHYLLSPALLEQSAASFAPLNEVPNCYLDSTIALGLRPQQISAEAEEALDIPASLPSLAARLGEINTPVTIVAGELDTHAVEQAPQLEHDIAGSSLIVVEGAGHYLWYAYPEIVVDAIQSTWDRGNQARSR